MIMDKNSPPKIDDTWYFRGKFMENLPLLQDGEYLWHKVQNCKRCGAKKTVKKYLAHVICKTGRSELKYFAIPSIIGSITQASKLNVTAFIKESNLMK